MKSSKVLFICFLLISSSIRGADVPIIFIHGHKSEAVPEDNDDKEKGGWKTWFPTMSDGITLKYHTAMTRIVESHYGGYRYGVKENGSPAIECDKNTNLKPNQGTKRIFNFSYYDPDGNPGVISLSEESVRVYISHGWDNLGEEFITVFNHPPTWGYDSTAYWPRYVPGLYYGELYTPDSTLYWCLYNSTLHVVDMYVSSWKEGKFAKRLAEFIDKVLAATGASKVDIVSHSMGGIVARAAIKNYGCANKVRKLLMVGTPNHTFSEWWEQWYIVFSDDKGWQKSGEDTELGVGPLAKFTDLSTVTQYDWHDFLGYSNYIEGMSTIAGDKGRSGYGRANDGVVAVEQVPLNSAQFNPVIYASHSYDGEPEIALTTCTYTTEFIKNWMIDDNTTHNGASVAGAFEAYDAVPFDNKWDNYELRLRLPVNDYNKALTVLSKCWVEGIDTSGNWQKIPRGYKAFPLYKYAKGCPGDPIFSHDPDYYIRNIWYLFYPNSYYLKIRSYVYDMDGLVSSDEEANSIDWSKLPKDCSVEVISPHQGDVFTVQTAYDKLTVKVKCNFYMAQSFTIYFSPDQHDDTFCG